MQAVMAKAVAKAALFHNGSNPSKNPVNAKLAICCGDFSRDAISVCLDELEI